MSILAIQILLGVIALWSVGGLIFGHIIKPILSKSWSSGKILRPLLVTVLLGPLVWLTSFVRFLIIFVPMILLMVTVYILQEDLD